MKTQTLTLWLAMLAGPLIAQDKEYVGIVSDTMCGTKHTMGISPDDKCVQECIKLDPKKWKYALVVAGKDLYVLSDQETPARFAAKKVRITGTLYAKTKILKVSRIEATR